MVDNLNVKLRFREAAQLNSLALSQDWTAFSAEYKVVSKPTPHDFSLRAPHHYLALLDARRKDGETWVEGLPRSTLQDGRGKLIFVPANCHFHGWAEPADSHVIFTAAYIDPLADLFQQSCIEELSPMLHFEQPVLGQMMVHMRALIERPQEYSRFYTESFLGLLIAELHHFQRRDHRSKAMGAEIIPTLNVVKGGLAAWQRRAVCEFIEEHLAEDISLARAASVVRLSPFHFCRAFKASLGRPPHQYQMIRRVERAKTLLANTSLSLTEIAASVGYSDANKFSTMFKKVVGQTPNGYRRALE